MKMFEEESAAHLTCMEALGTISEPIFRAAEVLVKALLDGNKLLVCGNGDIGRISPRRARRNTKDGI